MTVSAKKQEMETSSTSEDVSSGSQSSDDDGSDLSSAYFDAMLESMEGAKSSTVTPSTGMRKESTPPGTYGTVYPLGDTPATADMTSSDAGSSTGSENDEGYTMPASNLNIKIHQHQTTPSDQPKQVMLNTVPLKEAPPIATPVAAPTSPKAVLFRSGPRRGVGRSRSGDVGMMDGGDVQRLADSMGVAPDYFLKNPSALAPGGMQTVGRGGGGGRMARRGSVVASLSLIDVFEQEPVPMPEADLMSRSRSDSMAESFRSSAWSVDSRPDDSLGKSRDSTNASKQKKDRAKRKGSRGASLDSGKLYADTGSTKTGGKRRGSRYGPFVESGNSSADTTSKKNRNKRRGSRDGSSSSVDSGNLSADTNSDSVDVWQMVAPTTT